MKKLIKDIEKKIYGCCYYDKKIILYLKKYKILLFLQ